MPQKTISFNRVKMDDLVQIVNIGEQDDRARYLLRTPDADRVRNKIAAAVKG